ncbi:MAG: 50S ribosomal protein L4 [Eubacteriaceae bacterium]|jgi:large subunit ribosomal protein L4|nr:50S ribosomal protein L4 [Eubacteriaceae bacterium]
MPKIDVLNIKGEKVDEVTLSDEIFGIEPNEALVHQVVVAQLANKRQGTQSAKTRSEVRGGGRKPWRQKGTGRARAGTIRSPLFTGGGVIFAPKPRDYSQHVNKKMRRLAMKSVFSAKYNMNELIVLDKLELAEAKTREMAAVLKALNTEKALIVLDGMDENVIRSARNIPAVQTAQVNTINTYDMLKYDHLILTVDSLKKIEEVYS